MWTYIMQIPTTILYLPVKIDMEKQLVILEEEYEASPSIIRLPECLKLDSVRTYLYISGNLR